MRLSPPMPIVTLPASAGGLVCQAVSATLTVCRVLPKPLGVWGAFAMVLALGAFITAAGCLFLYLDSARGGNRMRRATDREPATAPIIHFPRRPPVGPSPEVSPHE